MTSKTHDFDDLKLLAGMEGGFKTSKTPLINWLVAAKWKPERRYEPVGTYDRGAAEEVLEAVTAYPDGVLACISSRW